jgi:uncharacterized protein (DUF427 family)
VRTHDVSLRAPYPPPRDPVGPGQVSVWDFPRPPDLVQWGERIQVVLGGEAVADTTEAWAVLETSHPPTYYLPQDCFAAGALRPASGASYCEWKGRASYLDLLGRDLVAEQAAWTYPSPTPGFAVLRDHVALYPGRVDACYVDGALVAPQPGGFYGGWVTPRVSGPFKGGPGSMGW